MSLLHNIDLSVLADFSKDISVAIITVSMINPIFLSGITMVEIVLGSMSALVFLYLAIVLNGYNDII